MGMKSRVIQLLFTAMLFNACGTSVTDDAQAGKTALGSGNFESAISHFRRIAESKPDYVIDTPPLRLGIWTYLGRAYYSAEKFGEAREALVQALKRDQKDFIARLYLGLTLLREDSRPIKDEGSLSLSEIVYALKEKVSPRRMTALIKEKGVSFTLSAEVERELRSLGADDELMNQIRSSVRITAQPSVREIERALKETQSWQATLRKSEYGRNWDQRKRISTQVESSLASISSKRTDRPEFVAGLEALGRYIDEEISLLQKK